MIANDELDRLLSGSAQGEEPDGLLAQMVARCDGEARIALDRIREVLSVVFAQRDPGALSIEQWRERLPTWFVQKFAAEITREEAERRKGLPLQQRAALAEHWSLSGWLYWFRPGERPWLWWSAEISSAHILRVWLVVPGLPFPSGSFEWVLRCADAELIEKENLR